MRCHSHSIQHDILRGSTLLRRDCDLDLDPRLQADTRLRCVLDNLGEGRLKREAHDLLDNLARGVQIDEAFVDFEFVTVPGLGALTARLGIEKGMSGMYGRSGIVTYHTVLRVVILRTFVGSLTGPFTRSCLSLARLMRSFETALMRSYVKHWLYDIRETIQDGRTLLKVPDVAASEGDAYFVEFRGRHCTGGVVFFIALSNVTHVGDSGD